MPSAGIRAGRVPPLWLTGLPSAGKTTLALALADVLRGPRAPTSSSWTATRSAPTSPPGSASPSEDRDTQVTRIGFVAELLARHGVSCWCR